MKNSTSCILNFGGIIPQIWVKSVTILHDSHFADHFCMMSVLLAPKHEIAQLCSEPLKTQKGHQWITLAVFPDFLTPLFKCHYQIQKLNENAIIMHTMFNVQIFHILLSIDNSISKISSYLLLSKHKLNKGYVCDSRINF